MRSIATYSILHTHRTAMSDGVDQVRYLYFFMKTDTIPRRCLSRDCDGALNFIPYLKPPRVVAVGTYRNLAGTKTSRPGDEHAVCGYDVMMIDYYCPTSGRYSSYHKAPRNAHDTQTRTIHLSILTTTDISPADDLLPTSAKPRRGDDDTVQ